MASVQSLGLGSGVLTSDLVDQLIKAERASTELRLDSRQQVTEARITAYGEIQSMMAKIQSAASSLSSPSLMGSTLAKSSDESILTATGSLTADVGSFNVEVRNIAKAHTLATATSSGFDEIIGTGKLEFTFGKLSYDETGKVTGQVIDTNKPSATIVIDESNNTLSGIRDAINSAKIGVTANIVNDGSGYRLSITSNETGEENAMQIRALDSNGNLLNDGLAALSFNPEQAGLEQTNKGEDALLRVNGLNITRSSNTVDEVIKGVTLNLKGADVGKSVTISVSPDTEKLSETVDSFVTAYNELKVFVDKLSSYDATAKQGGLLSGDSTIRSMMTQIRSLISEPIVGITSGFRSLTELGVNTDRNNKYMLTFDKEAFASAVNKDRSALVGVMAKTGIATDSQVTYVNDSVNTKPGTYAVNVTQLATQGKYIGAAATLELLNANDPDSGVIKLTGDASANTLELNVNGQFISIALEAKDYTGAEMAEQLALKINSDPEMSKLGHNVSVSFNKTSNAFTFTSNKYGSDSNVTVMTAYNSLANTLGFTDDATISQGKDVEGTINGVKAEGSGQFLRSPNGEIAATNGYTVAGNGFNRGGDDPSAKEVSANNPYIVNGDNKTFSINLDGITAEISLQEGSYSSHSAIAQALQTAINTHPEFLEKGVKVEYTDDESAYTHQKYSIISASTGTSSQVQVVSGLTQLGFGGGSLVESGKAAIKDENAASGLRLKITGTKVGDRGTITYVSGFGDKLKDIMDSFLNGKESVIATKKDALDKSMKAVSDDRAKMEMRLEAQEKMMRAKFAANDAIVATLNNTLDYVKQQFEAMNASKK